MIIFRKGGGMQVKTALAVVTVVITLFAQSDKKFQFYGFADMSITKYFPKDQSFVRSIHRLDEKVYFNLNHINLYGSFQPNKHLRFLTELSFQDKPVYDAPTYGMIYNMPPILDTVFTEPSPAPKNKVQKGIAMYEWGSFSVERALFTVFLNRYFNLSFGKFITPAGIWNVDHGSPVIMTIEQPSQYSHAEIYPKSQIGIMEEGTVFLGDADLSYSVYLSSGRDDQPIYKPNDLSVGGQLRFGLPVLDEFRIGLTGYTGRVNAKLRSTVINLEGMEYVDENMLLFRENIIGADFRISKNPVTLQCEVNYQHGIDYLNYQYDDNLNYQNDTDNLYEDSTFGTFATYVLGSVDMVKKENLRITPYAYYEYVKYIDAINDPTVDPMAISEGYHKFMGGVNFCAFTNYGIKLEYNFTRIVMEQSDPDKLNDIPGIASQFYIAF